MQVNNVQNSISFGAIILRDDRSFSRKFCDKIEEMTHDKKDSGFKSDSLAGKRLINEVIMNDYKTPELQYTYKRLVDSQKNNPVNIYIDLFTADPNEIPLHPNGWFQKATVGKRTFKQSIVYFNTPPSPIKFLKRACIYANILNFFKLGK